MSLEILWQARDELDDLYLESCKSDVIGKEFVMSSARILKTIRSPLKDLSHDCDNYAIEKAYHDHILGGSIRDIKEN